MTLGGLAAAIGVVIDDAIVMVENIVAAPLARASRPRDAAQSAIRELTPALIGSTLTPIVVFVPLVFLGGVTAVFFRALALTLVTALLRLAVPGDLLHAGAGAPLPEAARGPTETDLQKAEQAEAGRILRWLTARYEQRPALVAWPHPRWSWLGRRAGPGRLGGCSTTSSAAASCPRWTRAPSCSTTSCRRAPRWQETNRMLLRHREISARDAGGRELLAAHRRAARPVHRRAEHRRLPGEAQAQARNGSHRWSAGAVVVVKARPARMGIRKAEK